MKLRFWGIFLGVSNVRIGIFKLFVEKTASRSSSPLQCVKMPGLMEIWLGNLGNMLANNKIISPSA